MDQIRFQADDLFRIPQGVAFEQEDILHLLIADGAETHSLELSLNITVELNEQNELMGVEILHASAFLRDTVLESIQARTLQMLEARAA